MGLVHGKWSHSASKAASYRSAAASPRGCGSNRSLGLQHYVGFLLKDECAQRKVAVVELDPANDVLPIQPVVDVSELVLLFAQEEQKIGPNGGLVYCMAMLFKIPDRLEQRLKPSTR